VKKNVLEWQSLFFMEIANQAPHIVFDLFERNDSADWAKRWGFLSDWIIWKAESALEYRSGDRQQAHALRLRAMSHQPQALRCLIIISQTQNLHLQMALTRTLRPRLPGAINEEEELRAWKQAAGSFIRLQSCRRECRYINSVDG
jgi:hypothetical protein